MPSSLAINLSKRVARNGRNLACPPPGSNSGSRRPRRHPRPGQLGPELGHSRLDQFHQLAHEPWVEAELSPRRAVEFRQRTRGAQRQRAAVAGYGIPLVAQAVAPNLERAQLGDSVFDVVERVEEDVELPVPPGHALPLESAPIDALLEARADT